MEALKASEVKLTNGLFKERESINRNYLLSLDNRALLQNFYLEAGIILPDLQVVENPQNSYLHWGWEAPSCQLRGHFLGHWLSAAARLVSSNSDRELEAKLKTIIDELRICQENNGGKWIGSIPEKYFQRLKDGKYIWSPQYTLHKTLMGLLDAYVLTGYEPALDILDNASDWYVEWVHSLLDTPGIVLKGESGGMLEIWARLYKLTNKEKYLELANAYYYSEFDSYLEGRDVLTDNHANASIPQIHGAASMYEATGDGKWIKIIKEFWKQAVITRDSYATGGQNAGEFWIAPNMFYSAMSSRTQEFCTMYNMVRLADYLYCFTGDSQYTDYIEHILYNAFLTQQNKTNAMTTYFLPMAPASHKKWSTPTRDFWCCNGTMVQAQTLYTGLIYYKDIKENLISIEQYINSKADFDFNHNRISISIDTDMDYCQGALFGENKSSDNKIFDNKSRWSFVISLTSEKEVNLRLRIPGWAAKAYINGIEVSPDNGYYVISKIFKNEKIAVQFENSLSLRTIKDNENIAAVLDGPIVLAAIGHNAESYSLAGEKVSDVLTVFNEHTYDTYPWQQTSYRTKNNNGEVLFVPLYDITDEEYTIYIHK